MAQHTTRPELVKAIERRQFVLDLRCSGLSYREIANRTIAHFDASRLPANYDHRQACRDVQTELGRIAKETSADARILRAQEVERLDQLLGAVWPFALNPIETDEGTPIPNLGAIDRALRIAERRAKLLGIDMPSRVEINVPEAEIERLADEYLALRAAATSASESVRGNTETESGGGDDLA